MFEFDSSEGEITTHLKKRNFLTTLNFYIRSSIQEASRKSLYFFLAFVSTLIVVAATSISQTIIDYAPLIFLKACESNSASTDMRILSKRIYTSVDDGLSSSFEDKKLLFNTTRINERISSIYPDVTTSRIEKDVQLVVPDDKGCSAYSNPPYENCRHNYERLIAQDTFQEARLGMGIDLPLPNEIPEDSVILSTKQAKGLKVKKGDTIVLQPDLKGLLQELIINFNFQQTDTKDRIDINKLANTKVNIPLKVYAIHDSLTGKFNEETFATALVYELKHVFKVISKHITSDLLSLQNKQLTERLKQFIAGQKPHEYADIVLFNLKNRHQVYLDPNFDNIQISLTKFASLISKELGIFPYELELPVYETLYSMRFGAMFLGISVKIIITVLFILSIIVIYNLLLVTVETKTFEFGIIRMLGLGKMGVAELILIQALLFVLPGIVFGIIASIPLLGLISSTMQSKLQAEIPTFPTESAMFWAAFVGLLIPIISSYYPMKEALGKNLNMSLDQLRSKSNAIQVTIEINHKVIPWTRITFAVLAIAFGLALYLVLPLSMLTFNLGLLLTMFFMILVGIFLGLALLSLNFQYIVEKFVTTVFFFWTSESFRTLILKNLVAHKIRNRQTSLMYSLSLGFIIFLTVSLNQEVSNISYQIQAYRGALLTVWDTYGESRGAIEDHIAKHLTGVVESYAWITEDLDDFLSNRDYNDVEISHRGRLYSLDGRIFGVSPTIFNASLSRFLKVDLQDESSTIDLGEQLYTSKGSQSVIIGEHYREMLGLTLDKDSTLMITTSKGAVHRREELRILASLDFAPGFRFSRIPLLKNQDILISLPTYKRLCGDEIKTFEDLPLKKMVIKVKDDSIENMVKASESLSELRMRHPLSGMRIWDFANVENSLKSSEVALTIIFVSVEIIVMILSLFSLITSMSTNIVEQSKEIAVLRSIGVNQKTLNRLYVAESFVLVFASALFGALIGAIIGWTLSIQRVLFTQLPVEYAFPWRDLIVVFFVAVFSAFVSSYWPAKKLTEKSIGRLIRQND